jgi:M6 family metalloprotease-like protein
MERIRSARRNRTWAYLSCAFSLRRDTPACEPGGVSRQASSKREIGWPHAHRLALTLACLTAFANVVGQPALTPEDFGYGSLTANGVEIRGSFPLLVVTFELATNSPPRQRLIPNANQAFDQLIFNFFTFPSLNGYYLENSYGSFSWQRAGVIGPVVLDTNETATLAAQQSKDSSDGVTRFGLDSGAGIAYVLGRVAAATAYNFAQWDANADGSITPNELSIMLIGNNGEAGAANRPIGAAAAGFAVPGQNVTLRGRVASLDHRCSFMSMAHELSHSLGTSDLYAGGCFSSGMTTMSCTLYNPLDDRRTFHFDPWHKMRMGWLQPRVFPLATGGVATVTVSQFASPDTPVLLYDPVKGTQEYFLIEFRSNVASVGADHDANLTDPSNDTPSTTPTRGMAIWHVAPTNPPAFHEGAPNLANGVSALWGVGQITPPLPWNDGTSANASLNALGISADGRRLVFEWFSPSETWVDFAYAGIELGTFDEPFNSVAEGVAGASRGGTVTIKAGSNPEIITITNRVQLRAYGGQVRLGP